MGENERVRELFDRYIYAVVKRLPQKQRSDISRELRVLLDDMLDSRTMGTEASLADVGDEQRRITVALHKIVGGAVVVTAPCRVKQQLSRGLRRRKRKTNRLTSDAGINTLHILFSFLILPS